jgi:hypothetical protein
MTTDANNTFSKAEIFVNEVLFYGKDEIMLLGFLHDGGQFHETEYLISRNHLQTLLNANKRTGLEILWRIEELFVQPHQVPACINLVDVFGTTQVFDASEILLEIPACDSYQQLTRKQRGMLFVNNIITTKDTNKVSF